jgi:SAM-dependent methyltransferase
MHVVAGARPTLPCRGMAGGLYDRIGTSYTATRRADPRLAAAIWEAIGDAATVLNVGAGTGAYEPTDRDVVAVEPSAVMIAQRAAGSAKVVQASAEWLPFADRAFEVAMAVLSDHHWRDRRRGLRELERVARRRIVLFSADPAENGRFWMTTEYLPAFLELIDVRYRDAGAWARELEAIFGRVRLVGVPIPHDCVDGFYGAFWRRPEAFLDPVVRAGISVFTQLDGDHVERGLRALENDLRTGAWRERHRHLLELEELHLGYYVVVAELAG